MTVVNLFALRATDPARLRRARDPIGCDNGAARGPNRSLRDARWTSMRSSAVTP